MHSFGHRKLPGQHSARMILIFLFFLPRLMQLKAATDLILNNMRAYLKQVNASAYCKPVEALSNATIGQHTRHTLEFFLCIAEQSGSGTLNYDKRHRNHAMEVSPQSAIVSLEKIAAWFEASFADKHLLLRVALHENTNEAMLISTSNLREWTYALEHAIHHMAMIRIGAKFVAPELQLPDSFGISSSTIKYRKQCAQ